MATIFGKPQKTMHTVYVPIEGPRIRLTFNDISHMSMRPSVRTPGGFTVAVRFPADTWAGEQLEVLDAEALAATFENNNAWFKNGLTKEKIQEFFEPSLELASNSAKATFYVSPAHPPQLRFENEAVESIDAFYAKWSAAPHRGQNAVIANATVNVVGILFEKQRFRLRIMLRGLEAQSNLPPLETTYLVPDRRELEEHWRTEINTALNPQIAVQEQRLQKMVLLKQDLLKQLEVAERIKDGPSWDAHLASIAQTLRDGVWNYLT